jgi:inner membrane protein
MDNVTHSLIGLAIGDAVAVYTKKARVPIWIASAAANNLPDLDVLLTSTLFRDKLGYLLHHRGHSHTFPIAPLLSLSLLLFLWGRWKKRDIPWAQVALVSFLGVLTHLFADFWNSYGVHPLWPFDNSWHYGDMIFIVEPWIWVLLIPPLFMRASSRTGRGILLFFGALIFGLSWYHSMVPWQAAAILTVCFAAWIFAQKYISSAGLRIGLGIAGVGAVLASMHFVSDRAKGAAGPGEEIVATPFPANPLCWNIIRAKLNADEYTASVSVTAPFPSLVKAEDCPAIRGVSKAPFALNSEQTAASEKTFGVFRAPRSEYDSLSQDCRMNAFLRFARAPYWKRVNGGWLVGDLRFDRSEALGFAELFLEDGDATCPKNLAPWEGRFFPHS